MGTGRGGLEATWQQPRGSSRTWLLMFGVGGVMHQEHTAKRHPL